MSVCLCLSYTDLIRTSYPLAGMREVYLGLATTASSIPIFGLISSAYTKVKYAGSVSPSGSYYVVKTTTSIARDGAGARCGALGASRQAAGDVRTVVTNSAFTS